MAATCRGVCRTLGVMALAAFCASVAVSATPVTTNTWMEYDLLGGGRLGHDRGRAGAQVGHGRRGLSRSSELDDERRFRRVVGRRPGQVAIACRPPDNE